MSVHTTTERKRKMSTRATAVFYHDDPPCNARLEDDGTCKHCKVHPDTQSKCIYYHCPKCGVRLIKMRCPECQRVF
ncbi:MAG: hypothetical protein ABH884_01545 [Candidatus Komeilibacteria bacterium]